MPTTTPAAAALGTEGIREGYAELSEARLHYVEAGEGPLVVLLHGYPEFWFSWRHQIPPLAAAGFRVVAPDMRGYNLSSRPAGVGAYTTDHLARDVHELIRERGATTAFVAGHDWGGTVAWVTAMNHPEVVERLAILNSPHPRRLQEGWRTLRQLRRSWYVFFYQLPWLPELALRSRNYSGFRAALASARHGAFSDADLEHYVAAWSQPGAVTAMVNYYRGLFRPSSVRARSGKIVTAPTRVLWGQRDHFLEPELAEPHPDDVPNLEGVVRLADSSHWVQHDAPERVTYLLTEFFSR